MLKHVVEWSEKELSPAMEVLGELSIRALDSCPFPILVVVFLLLLAALRWPTDEGDWYYSLPSHSPLNEKARMSPLTSTTPGHDSTFRYPGNPSHGENFDQPRTYHSALYRPDGSHAQSLGSKSTGSTARSTIGGNSGMGRRGKIRGMLDMRRTSSLTRVDEELGEVECEA